MAAKLLSNSFVPLVAVVRFKSTFPLLAFKPPLMVLVAPPLVLKVLVVPNAPIGLPPKFIVPPPSPPVKLKAVLFQRPLLDEERVNDEALTTFTAAGANQG